MTPRRLGRGRRGRGVGRGWGLGRGRGRRVRRLRALRGPGSRIRDPRLLGPPIWEGSPTGRDGRACPQPRVGQVPACDGRSRPCTTHRGDQCSGAVVRRRWAWSGSTVQPLATSQASAAVRAGSRRGRAGPGAARPGRARGGRPGSRPSPGSRPGARAGPGSGGRVAVHDRVRGAGQGRPGGPAHGHHLGRHPAQVHVAAALRGQQTRVPGRAAAPADPHRPDPVAVAATQVIAGSAGRRCRPACAVRPGGRPPGRARRRRGTWRRSRRRLAPGVPGRSRSRRCPAGTRTWRR